MNVEVKAMSVLMVAALSATAFAQPVTTIITHGFDINNLKGAWVEEIAYAIIVRAGGQGCVLRYDQDSGDWNLDDGSNPVNASYPIILIFRWFDEVEGANLGPEFGFAEGAADALYSALRDPAGDLAGIKLLQGRITHFIGHSRGACVNSEVVRRLASAGPEFGVDQVTSLDPHPIADFNGDGEGDLDQCILCEEAWGDPLPRKWSNVTWADNYWRSDGGGLCDCDVDGIALPDSFNVLLCDDILACTNAPNCETGDGDSGDDCGYGIEHADTHLWYHGTINLNTPACDGDQCIDASMRAQWYTTDGIAEGYYYSLIGGGAPNRPIQPPGEAPGAVPLLYNGTFENASYAGWVFHGGGGSGDIVSKGSQTFLKLGANVGASRTHNRFWLPADAESLTFVYKVFQADTLFRDDTVKIRFADTLGNSYESPISILLDAQSNGWLPVVIALPSWLPTGQTYTLTFEIDWGLALEAIVGIDDITITDLTDDDIHFVPSEFSTIQAAINAAVDGDEVVVAPGTYLEAIDFVGKTITVRSAAGSDVTIIDPPGGGSVVTCTSGQSLARLLSGFTLTGGSAPGARGGGINCDGGSLTVQNCILIDNSARWGGGIYNRNNSSLVQQCVFFSNAAGIGGAGHGGGMINDMSSATVVGCRFEENIANVSGGGIANFQGTVFVTASEFIANSSPSGGGVYNESTSPTISDCEFLSNSASVGAGMGNNVSNAQVSGCVFADNIATSAGGGMFNGNSLPTVSASTFCENAPGNISGSWTDKGGNCFADTCTDNNGNSIPDECEELPCPWDCGNSDGTVGIVDFLKLLKHWGLPSPCDVDGGGVGIADFLALLSHWGPCPASAVTIDFDNLSPGIHPHDALIPGRPHPRGRHS